MIVEVIAVGTELLLGQIVNSNVAYIGTRLAESGLDAHHQVVVGDNLDRLRDSIEMAVDRADAVIITGGIGPTPDDLTREAISAATGRHLIRDETYVQALVDRFAALGRDLPANNLQQADCPEGGTHLPNPKGTAPGIELDVGDAVIYALPGVPSEMYQLLDDHVMPRLRRRSGDESVLVNRVLRSWGRGESAVAELLDDLYHATTNPSMAYLASDGEITIRLSAKAPSDAAARRLIEPIESEVRSRLGDAVFATDAQTIGEVLLAELSRRNWTIATAESMTGGLVGARLTSQPGISAVYLGGVVTYATAAKRSMLGVADDTLTGHGVVSPETAAEMASQVRAVMGADVGVAVTGSAGPEPQEHPPGTVFVAVHTPDAARVRRLTLPGDRERVRAYTATASLHLARLGITGAWWSG